MRPATLAAGLGAAVPVVVSTVRGMADGVLPTGDRAIIALRSYDVFTSHMPLVGQYSASTVLGSHVVHSPGPLLYWLLALPARFGAPSSLALAVGAVNILSVLASVALARRRGGAALMLATAIAMALLSRSWSPQTLHDIWNPSAALLPLLLLAFLCWSVACGEYRLLPLTALTASFTIQSQLAFLAPSLVLSTIALAGLLLGCLRARRVAGAGRPSRVRAPAVRRARGWAWALATTLVLAACWSAPVVDQLEHSPGNLTLLAREARAHEPKQGLAVGWHAVVRAIGVPPWWLRAPSEPFSRFGEVRRAPGTAAVVTAIALLLALAGALLAGVLARRRELVSAAAIGLALCVALGAVAAATPTRPSIQSSLGYTMWWGSIAGMWVWLSVGGLLAVGVAGILRSAVSIDLGRAWAPALAAVVLGGVAAAVSVAQGPDQDRWEYRPARAMNRNLLGVLRPAVRAVRVVGSPDFTAFDFRAAADFALRRHGVRPVDPAASVRLDSAYALGAVPYQAVLHVIDAGGRRAAGRQLALIAAHGRHGHPIRVTLERSASPPARR